MCSTVHIRWELHKSGKGQRATLDVDVRHAGGRVEGFEVGGQSARNAGANGFGDRDHRSNRRAAGGGDDQGGLRDGRGGQVGGKNLSATDGEGGTGADGAGGGVEGDGARAGSG